METYMENAKKYLWNLLPDLLQIVLPSSYNYLIQQFTELSPYQTEEGFEVLQFEVKTFVNVVMIKDIKVNFPETEELEYQTNNSLEELECQVNNSFETAIEALEQQINNLSNNSLEKSECQVNDLFKTAIEVLEQQTDNSFINFLEDIKEDYEKQDLQLCAALEKFSAQYKAAKSQSIPRIKRKYSKPTKITNKNDTYNISKRKVRKT
ncbi:9752_t:CDS:2, partial [Dentiscutata erythropus]